MYSLALPVSITLTTNHDDSADLMAACRSSTKAFMTLVNRNRLPLLAFFSRQGARHESEDLVQETFIRLFRYRDRYQPGTTFSGFLFTIARHAWADHCRKTMRWQRFFTRYEQESTLSEHPQSESSGHNYDVEAALTSLSPRLREVIDLHFYQGLRQNEVATRLGVPLGTVKSRIFQAMKLMRDQREALQANEAATATY